MKTTTTPEAAQRFQLTPRTDGRGLEIVDTLSGTVCTTTAPVAACLRVLRFAEPAWLACDVAGFAERLARRNFTPPQLIDNGRTFRPVAQPDLFAAA